LGPGGPPPPSYGRRRPPRANRESGPRLAPPGIRPDGARPRRWGAAPRRAPRPGFGPPWARALGRALSEPQQGAPAPVPPPCGPALGRPGPRAGFSSSHHDRTQGSSGMRCRPPPPSVRIPSPWAPQVRRKFRGIPPVHHQRIADLTAASAPRLSGPAGSAAAPG